jgi:hypothetical protein
MRIGMMGIQKLIKMEIGRLDITLELVSSRTTKPPNQKLTNTIANSHVPGKFHFILSRSLLWIGCAAL